MAQLDCVASTCRDKNANLLANAVTNPTQVIYVKGSIPNTLFVFVFDGISVLAFIKLAPASSMIAGRRNKGNTAEKKSVAPKTAGKLKTERYLA
mmetsp:Transcript_2363/g.3023  ORF Transcript_2363/g.3023 Transcript_2363/m.3023 type:complete len:94 (+) Transcript_2363:1137-1418(+)